MLGAPQKFENEDPYIQAAVQFTVLEINNLTKGKKVRVLVDVKEGTTQVGYQRVNQHPWVKAIRL